MSEDLIKRSDAIKALGEEPYVWTDDDEFAQGERSQWIDDVSAINAIPSADRPQEWIPCSERMPNEEEATYLICTDSEYMCSCRWTNKNPIWADLTTEWHWCLFDIPQYSIVVAWMPLKPWKGADDETD